MAKKNIIKKTTKKLNKTARKINKWERKNPGTALTVKIGTAVAGGIATKIIVKNEVKKQLEAAKAEQNPAPAPEKKKGLAALPIVGKFFDKKEETASATPTETEAVA